MGCAAQRIGDAVALVAERKEQRPAACAAYHTIPIPHSEGRATTVGRADGTAAITAVYDEYSTLLTARDTHRTWDTAGILRYAVMLRSAMHGKLHGNSLRG